MTLGRARSVLVDAVLAAVACAMDLTLYSSVPLRADDPRFWTAVGYLGLVFGALLVRRRHPAAAFAVVLVLAVLVEPLTGLHFRPALVVYLALFSVAVSCRKEVAVAALAGGLACAVRIVSRTIQVESVEELVVEAFAAVYLMALPLATWVAGRWVRTSREHAKDLEARRELEARQAVAGERARIARELHDVVSHAVTVMVLQAAGGRRALHRDPARAERVFDTIGQVGEQAMEELRRMLAVLRTDGPEEPRSGVADLPRLLDPVRAVGVDVALRVVGEPRAVEPGVDLAVYRVVQEGLTNVTKHAGAGARAEVRLTWSGDRVEVEVVDDGGEGEPRRDLSTGHGLAGLRQRLAVLGGDLTAGESHGGGFRLAAVLPVGGRLVPADRPPSRVVQA
ncbi:sensor histidine kinase [Saccharothrix xinjiangensis]|uniref:histidine kinase n=1 Tax=Saccharothrix xinjiangensis TaxID=204798 RepID=A0ABV9XZ96_9PSEU